MKLGDPGGQEMPQTFHSVLSSFCLFPWAPPSSWEELTGSFWSCCIQGKKPGPSIAFLSYRIKSRGSLRRGEGM